MLKKNKYINKVRSKSIIQIHHILYDWVKVILPTQKAKKSDLKAAQDSAANTITSIQIVQIGYIFLKCWARWTRWQVKYHQVPARIVLINIIRALIITTQQQPPQLPRPPPQQSQTISIRIFIRIRNWITIVIVKSKFLYLFTFTVWHIFINRLPGTQWAYPFHTINILNIYKGYLVYFSYIFIQ